VARGAATKAAYQRGDIELDVLPDRTITNVLSHNMGVEVQVDGKDDTVYDRVLEEGMKLPDEETRTYTNPEDYISEIKVTLREKGDHRQSAETADKLGEATIQGIPEKPKGEVDIEVTFEAAQDGTINVTAVEPETGGSVEFDVQAEVGMSDEEKAQIADEDTGPVPPEKTTESVPAVEDDD
jgi:molecular chaperone DnaK